MSRAFPPEFTMELSTKLIQMYETKRILWDSTLINYRNTNHREDAWAAISKELGIPVSDLKKKMKTLLATNRKERSKTKKRTITGLGADDVYKSKWFGYEHFLFLNDKDLPVPTHATIQDTVMESSTVHNSANSGQGLNDSAPSTQHQHASDTTPTQQDQQTPRTSQTATQQQQQPSDNSVGSSHRSYRKKRRLTSDRNNKEVVEAMGLLRQSVQAQPEDSYTSFGVYIGHELRKYDMRTLALIKQAINNALFQADMGQLPGQVSACYGYSSHSTPHHSTSTPNPTPVEILPVDQNEFPRQTDDTGSEDSFTS